MQKIRDFSEGRGGREMCSRRKFLMGLLLFASFVFYPRGLINKIHHNSYNKSGRFIKEGWVLQEGDV